MKLFRKRAPRRVKLCQACDAINPLDALICEGCESPRLQTMTTEQATNRLAGTAALKCAEGLARINQVAR